MVGGEGSAFGKYYLQKKIAIGGMGEIFLAKLTGPVSFEKLLIIKRILAEHQAKQEYLDMFFAEASLVAQLNHSNIVQIYEMGQIENAYFIAMEYVHGKTLRDLLERTRTRGESLHPALAIEIISDLCNGMSFAHNALDISGNPLGVIHRDINPHNILISYSGDVKVIDFGIAKSDIQNGTQDNNKIKGKCSYMSPEQSTGAQLDKRSDIFSIGICLYEALTFVNPFARNSMAQTLEMIRHKDPESISKNYPKLQSFDAILQKALAKKIEDRYADCSEMRQTLQRMLRMGDVRPAPMSLADTMQDLFEDTIESERRMIADTGNATSLDLKSMRDYQKLENSQPVLRLHANIGRNSNKFETINAQPGAFTESKHSRVPFFLTFVLILVASAAGALASVRYAATNQEIYVAVATKINRPSFLPLPAAKQQTFAVKKRPILHDIKSKDSSVMTAMLDTKSDADVNVNSSKAKTSDSKKNNSKSVTASPEPRNEPNKNENNLNTTEPSKTDNVAKIKADTKKLAKTSREREHRKIEKPAPVRTPPPPPINKGFGSLRVSVVPPVRISLNGVNIGQTFKIKSDNGVLVLGTGADIESDPFKVSISYKIDNGSISYSIQTDPWAIVHGRGGIGLGKTPLSNINGGSSTLFELNNPKESRQLRITLHFTGP
ncbi:MAG: protein kinase [Deltaproteobacteria bacterium]|nr:protein kinase [Deltaproteobacteria bacterium]